MKNIAEANAELIKAIDSEAPPDRLIRALAGALEADQVARDGTRAPDYRVRVQAATAILQYRLGRPDVRSSADPPNTEETGGESFQDKLKRSPALRSMLRQMVEKAEQA